MSDEMRPTPTKGYSEFIQKRMQICADGSGILTWQQYCDVSSRISELERDRAELREALVGVIRESDRETMAYIKARAALAKTKGAE